MQWAVDLNWVVDGPTARLDELRIWQESRRLVWLCSFLREAAWRKAVLDHLGLDGAGMDLSWALVFGWVGGLGLGDSSVEGSGTLQHNLVSVALGYSVPLV